MPEDDVRKWIADGRPEWAEGYDLWEWLLDSYEGGTAYVEATYAGWEVRGLPGRNLIRHKHEQDILDSGGVLRENPDYALRRARTPVPEFTEEILEAHLGAIYEQEVRRDCPASSLLRDWWEGKRGGVDGTETSMGEWFPEEFAPYFLLLGFVDVLALPPAPRDGKLPVSQADVRKGNLDGCVLHVVFPQRVRWWELEPGTAFYRRALVQETAEDGSEVYRLWDAAGWVLYDAQGKEESRGEHPFGRVPMQRLFLRRRSRRRFVGISIYEKIAACQRSAYNVWSEVELTNARDSHAITQGPERDCDPTPTAAGGEPPAIPWSPRFGLPKRIVRSDNGTAFEQKWEYIEPPSSPIEMLLKCYDRLADRADKLGRVTKPAGSTGTSSSTQRQTAEAKTIDERGGFRLLSRFARKLAEAEWAVASLAAAVLHRGKPPENLAEGLKVVYPTRFNLRNGAELAELATEYQSVIGEAGKSPEVEKRFAHAIVRDAFPGLDESEYDELEADADAAIDLQAEGSAQAREGLGNLFGGNGDVTRGSGEAESGRPSAASDTGAGPREPAALA